MAHDDHNQDLVFQEVDEQLAEERLRRLWENYKVWIVGGFVAFFAALAIFVGVKDYYRSLDHDASDQYLKAVNALQSNNAAQADSALKRLQSKHGDHGYGLLSHLAEARMLVEKGDNDAAIQTLDGMIAKADRAPLSDLARLNAAYVLSKTPERAMAYLDAIKDPSAYSAHAYEMRGLIAQVAGENKQALAHYQKAMQYTPAMTLSQRLMERMVRLGGMDAVKEAQMVQPAKVE
ncbi:tetratricopeptide repeat protein [Magnetococcus sp. PR-3]|uniref:tetratricopeptide repeat protein n=1 Tax=Magnetococcus sp. PR-3 TaxID=3120355 RepID=UPI002FCE4DAF